MANGNKPNILYIDDEVINLEMFKYAFRKVFNIQTVESGREALKLVAQDNSFELVLCDMKMPKMDGLEFVRHAKMIKADLPCIILSGYEKTKDVIEAIENGVIYEYVMKPFDKSELEQCILNALD